MNDRQAYGDHRYVVDRGWSVHIGSIKLVRWHRFCTDGVPAAPPRGSPRPVLLSGSTAFVGGLIGLCTFAATSLVAAQVGAKPTYAISIPVPPAIRRANNSLHTSGLMERLRHPAAATATATSRTATAAVALVDPRPAALLIGENVAQQLPEARSQASAVKAALVTGDMQEWGEAASGVHGFIVAGSLQTDGDKQCRSISVLTRSAAGDAVDQQRACLR